MKAVQPLIDANPPLPTRGRAERRGVRHIPKLIAGSPIMGTDGGAPAIHLLQAVQQFDEAEAVVRSSAQVEGAAGNRIDVLQAGLISLDRIADIEQIAHLASIAEHIDRLALAGADQEM